MALASREANCAAQLTDLGIDPETFLPSDDPSASLFTEGSISGNTDLSEETATTWTAGVVLRPEFAPGLSVSLDWYDIEIEDAINTPEAIELAELCVDQPSLDNQFCDSITRDAETGFITGFSVQPDNVASFRTAGLDVALDYRIGTDSSGDFAVQLVAGYLDRLEFIVNARRRRGFGSQRGVLPEIFGDPGCELDTWPADAGLWHQLV